MGHGLAAQVADEDEDRAVQDETRGGGSGSEHGGPFGLGLIQPVPRGTCSGQPFVPGPSPALHEILDFVRPSADPVENRVGIDALATRSVGSAYHDVDVGRKPLDEVALARNQDGSRGWFERYVAEGQQS